MELDHIPLIPLMDHILRRTLGNEHCNLIESLFEYAAGNYDAADRLKKKCRRCLWKDIDIYRFAIDQYYEGMEDHAEQDS